MQFPDISNIYKRLTPTEAVPPPSGISRDYYLDLAEPLARQAVGWQDKAGKIIDPFENEEKNTATPRFVGALGALIQAGRCADLVGCLEKSMEAGTRDLSNARDSGLNHAEFYVKELMQGYLALQDKSADSALLRWEKRLGGYDPEKNYGQVFSKRKPEEIHNFATFAIAGESMKRRFGIADNADFIEKYIEHSKQFFTPLGMYRDPNDPMTYDYTSRMNLSLAEHYGYDGANAAWLRETLRKGALTMLLYLSPAGEAPFGGRSNQQHFNESTIALICEYEARKAKAAGDEETAGMFKRAAHLSAVSMERWLKLPHMPDLKNSFPPDSRHGRQKLYGFYSAYSLLIGSLLGFAYTLADDSIEEVSAPCEAGGYILSMPGAFHKVFATCSGYHLEIDTRADFDYDATGLGRVHKKGSPSELAISAPFTQSPNYNVSSGLPPRNVAIGPGWEDETGKSIWLSDLSAEIPEAGLKRIAEEAGRVEFNLDYKIKLGGKTSNLGEHYVVKPSGIEIEYRCPKDARAVFAQVPLIETDGAARSRIETGRSSFSVSYRGKTYSVICTSPGARAFMEPFPAPNRNGIYRIGVFRAGAGTLKLNLSIA